ncbi:hypothetical protein JCGZ_00386 [Jatropha curcas]|uniref:VHS domain-containing protein n=1 Tax=Jatropha curcas TaxID=180498 RepID=A0A067JTD9_JATCU|nr:TOM1-like protein 6 [Jatropha curcas]XP_037493259.1 TOM1-like protein 6 [Jatropha curcas]KDP22799.1 hypothetical protein JCGZ_00386 [Jatropha curcas]
MAMAMASSSSSSASVAVEKATSDLLIGPDWTMNIDICDSVNSNHWLAKDVVKAVKKRLQHKNPKVQLLALTLLETMVKNCGDFVHFQIAEKNILGEMVRIVKKKSDMHVRDKILVLLDSWQEAFGGPGGKHPQYYWAYEELRRSGVEFPQRSLDAAPIFTPPVTHSTLRHSQAGYGMPINSSRRLDETMATESEGLSLSSMDSIRNVMELLSDMLQAVNPDDRGAVKDELIVDLVDRCRSNQKILMQMLTTTGDEELLGQGLELNDGLQILLVKHDAIASGSPMPTTNLAPKPGQLSNTKPNEVKDSSTSSSSNATVPVASVVRSHIDEEDEEEDDFAQLARRHSKARSSLPQSGSGTSKALVSVDTSTATSSTPIASSPALSNALTLTDPPAPVKTTKEQDIIDLLSISLSTSHVTPTPHTPTASNQSMPQAAASSTQGNPYSSQIYSENQGQATYNSYVVPWAQPQPQHQLQHPSQPQHQLQPQSQPQPQQQFHPQSHLQPHSPTQHQQQFQPQSQFQTQFQPRTQHQFQSQSQSQPANVQPQPQQQFQPQSQPQLHPQPGHQPQQQFQPHSQSQLHMQPQLQTHQQFQPQSQPNQQFQAQSQRQFQPQLHSQYHQYPSGYPPPPWAGTPGYANGQSHMSTTSNVNSTLQANTSAVYTPAQASRPMLNNNAFSRQSNGLAANEDPRVSSGPRNPTPPGQKPFIPTYRLFEDLNVLTNTDGRFKMTGSTSPSLSGPSTQGMVGGRK